MLSGTDYNQQIYLAHGIKHAFIMFTLKVDCHLFDTKRFLRVTPS